MNTFWFNLLPLHVYLGNSGKRWAKPVLGIVPVSVSPPILKLFKAGSMTLISSLFLLQLISFITSINLIFSVKIKSAACRKERKVWLSGNLEI